MRQLTHHLRTRGFVIAHDIGMIPVAWFGAYWLRFNLESIPDSLISSTLFLLPVIVAVQGASFWYFGLYRGVWHFASLPDLLRIGKAVAVGTLLVAMAVFLLTRLQGVPRSVFPLYGMLLMFLVGGPRLLFRWYKDRRLVLGAGERALIVGAGRAGEMLVRDLLRNSNSQIRPVGFVDDDRTKQGMEIHGCRVFGATDSIPQQVQTHAIDLVIIAIPSARSGDMRRIVEACEEAGAPFRTLPGIDDIVSGRATLQTLREVSIDDLLGREPVSLDWKAIGAGLVGRCVLVTGGGGSIGAELCRQIARLEPRRLVVLDNGEFNLYDTERRLRQDFPRVDVLAWLGDAADPVAVEGVFARFQPEVVFHAAAYKHVPMLENMVRSAVRNNLFGTRLVADAADRHAVETFVLISTDKAVNPTNVMGATKRVAEIYCQQLNAKSRTRFITVRFGNVLGSAGSVVPLFREQIAKGGPVTVTHPDVTRYFMTIPEACQLIMQAAVVGQGGEIFVLDMGEPIKISYLAEQMIRLAGKVPGEDIEIAFTGLRPGEKLFEELFHDRESLAATSHPKLLLAHPRRLDEEQFFAGLEALIRFSDIADEVALRKTLKGLVPEYRQDEKTLMPLPGKGGGNGASAVGQPSARHIAAEAEMTT